MRYYVVMGRNGGRKGASTQRLPVALRPAPPAPPQPTSTLAENYVELDWTEPPGLPKPVHKGTAPPPRPARVARRDHDTVCASCRSSGAPPVAPTDDDDDELPTPVAPPPAPVPTPPPVETPPEVPVPAPPPAPVATGAIAVPGAAVAGETPAPTLLNSRSLTGFPSVTVGYSIYEVPPPHQAAHRAAAAWRSAAVAAAA